MHSVCDLGLEPLGDDDLVFRLASADYPHYTAGASTPHPDVFRLTRDDKEQIPPRLSVFDSARTTVDQAIAIRLHVRGGGALGPQVAFALGVAAVRRVDARLDVVRDELPLSLAGSDGHAGVVGLDAVEALGRKARRNVRSQLADLCAPIA